MKFDFDQVHNRRNTNSYKWDVPENELPMWVADMDFQTAPAVIEAIERRARQGIFGYNNVPDTWYEAIISWWSRRHRFEIDRDWLIFCTGVVPAITSSVKRITNIGDSVLVMTPVYDIFFHSIENMGRHTLECQLAYDGNAYSLDFADLEEKLKRPLTTMLIFCNPHNPVGKIWTREELQKIGELCQKYHVTVLSDEIHCDITTPGKSYIPFASASDVCKDISMTCISATKAFNFAGLQTSAVVIANEALREKVNRGLNADEVAEPNTFATEAVIAAFNEGEEWLNELNEYLEQNKKFAENFIKEQLPELKVVASEATYLLWVDCSNITSDTTQLCEYLKKEAGLYVSTGAQYRGNGRQFFRMNLACPKARAKEGLKRLKNGIDTYVLSRKE